MVEGCVQHEAFKSNIERQRPTAKSCRVSMKQSPKENSTGLISCRLLCASGASAFNGTT